MKRLWLFLIACLLPTAAWGLNETPTSTKGVQLEPYSFHLGQEGAQFYTAAIDQGYAVEAYVQSEASADPEVTLARFASELCDGNALFFVSSHGSTSGFAVQAYPYVAAPACETDFEEYLDDGWTEWNGSPGNTGEIYMGSSAGGVHISIRPSAVASRFVSCNSIVYNTNCYGHSMEATAFGAARCRLGYPGETNNQQGRTESNTFWLRMDGGAGKANRTCTNAKNNLVIALSGDGATVLAPVITSISPSANSHLYGDVTGFVEFDTRMNTTNDPAWVVYGNPHNTGGVYADNASWSGDHRINFTLSPYRVGLCQLVVGNAAEAAGDCQIVDGNTNPWGSDGYGPNRDIYVINLTSHVEDPNLAARFEGSWAFEENGTRFAWVTDPELGSTSFDVYADGALVTTVPAAGAPDRPHYYEISVPSAHEYYVVEHDANPTTPDDFSRPVTFGPPPENLASLRDLNTAADRWNAQMPEQYGAGGNESFRSLSVTDFVYYSSRQDLLDATLPMRQWWSSRGYTSQTLCGSSNPAECRTIISYIWQQAVNSSYPRLPFLVIVGEANQGSEPQKNIVGAFAMGDPDTSCMWGCVSDALIADCDGDSLPDVPWVRMVGYQTTEIARMATSAVELYNNQNISPSRALFFVGDLNFCTTVPEPAATIETIRGWYEGRNISTVRLRDSDFTNCSDFTSRLNAAIGAVNTGITEIVGMGYTTNRSIWPGFFFQKTASPVFSASYLTRRQRIVCELPGCGLGDCDRNNPSYYPSITKMMLTADPAAGTTAVAVLGHIRGGFETQHTEFAERYFDERLNGTNATIQHAYFHAIRRFAADEPSAKSYLLMAGSFGAPAWVPGLQCVGVEDAASRIPSFAFTNEPNPVANGTIIRFSLPTLARVHLAVYDIQGRCVRTLLDGSVHEPGTAAYTWDGRNERGNPVASGMYFARLKTDQIQASRKMIVMH